ncbi:hypothetical protein [Mongoliimonas terrestris]|uniref:hypothetical protein n=1 Tax=Mongoliimonas terrestris TaxID=1709001 RepID=UPI0009496F05|nr:hypothetical protein [Mongoliimonas terrestris]
MAKTPSPAALAELRDAKAEALAAAKPRTAKAMVLARDLHTITHELLRAEVKARAAAKPTRRARRCDDDAPGLFAGA